MRHKILDKKTININDIDLGNGAESLAHLKLKINSIYFLRNRGYKEIFQEVYTEGGRVDILGIKKKEISIIECGTLVDYGADKKERIKRLSNLSTIYKSIKLFHLPYSNSRYERIIKFGNGVFFKDDRCKVKKILVKKIKVLTDLYEFTPILKEESKQKLKNWLF